MAEKKSVSPWSLYILRCTNGSLYTGITNNLEKRFKAHQRGKGSWFTRVFGAEEILYTEEVGGKREAFIRERAVKRLTRKQKLALIEGSPKGKDVKKPASLKSRCKKKEQEEKAVKIL